MGLEGADRVLKRVVLILGVCAVAVLVGGLAFEFWHTDGGATEYRAIELAAVDVSFVGSGANNATFGQNPCGCGSTYPVGESFYSDFNVETTYEFYCTPHTWSITQVSGSSGGGFVITNVRAMVYGPSSALPVTVPVCAGGQSYNGAMIGYNLTVLDSGPSIQTLYLTVTVDQIS